MTIGEPMNEREIIAAGSNSSYRELYKAVEKAGDAYVPVKCADIKEFNRTYNACRQNGRFVIRRRTDELTLYVAKKRV